jgi:single-stranded-DNA-specific exonuclease
MSAVNQLERYGFKLSPNLNSTVLDCDVCKLSNIQKNIYSKRIPGDSVDITDYIYNKIDLLNGIEALPDIDKAADLLIKHLNIGNHIAVVTDYDADGVNSAVTATRILLEIFKYPKEKVTTLVNRRLAGNGFNSELMGRITKLHLTKPIGLVIAADHGSSNNTEYGVLSELGIETLITDHHEVPVDNYPINATCFINNQREDSTYPKAGSGCFIVFITLVYTYNKLYPNQDLSIFNSVLPYVAITTITDVRSLALPLNRHIVRTGLNEMNSFRNRAWWGIRAVLGIPGKFSFKDIGFKLGPLINTANRLDCEDLAYKMLMGNSYTEGNELALEMAKLNTHRKNITKNIVKATLEEVENSITKDKLYGLVVLINAEIAINGNVAASVGNMYALPTVCFIDTGNDIITGSSRSIIKDLNILEVFTSIHNEDPSIIVKYGGHYGAAGCSVYRNKLNDFKILFNKYCKELTPETEHNIIYYDMFVPDYLITTKLAIGIDACGPYGKDWEEPILLSKLTIGRLYVIGNSIAKITFVRNNGTTIEAMHFFNYKSNITAKNIRDELPSGTVVYVAYNLSIDSYLNNLNLNMNIVDIKKEIN